MDAKYVKEEKSRTIAVLKMGPKIGKGNRMRSSKSNRKKKGEQRLTVLDPTTVNTKADLDE